MNDNARPTEVFGLIDPESRMCEFIAEPLRSSFGAWFPKDWTYIRVGPIRFKPSKQQLTPIFDNVYTRTYAEVAVTLITAFVVTA